MLELKPVCENCSKEMPFNSAEAMICTFECTFCKDCVENILFNVCPNCGGGFEKRPARPKGLLNKYPASGKIFTKSIQAEEFAILLKKYRNVDPSKRD